MLVQYDDVSLLFTQGSHALNPRFDFISTLPLAFQEDIFLLIEFKIIEVEDCFMQLLVAESLKN